MGSLCFFPAKPLNTVVQAVSNTEGAYNWLQHTPNPWAHQNLIQKVCMYHAHGLVPCQSSHLTGIPTPSFSYVFMVIRLPNIITCSFRNKVLQTHVKTRQFEPARTKEKAMVSPKRIAQLAKKWQRMAAMGRKKLSWGMPKEANEYCAPVVDKGHCTVYTADGGRFQVPLEYLSTPVFAELLLMSQEEFGFISDERITLPCDAEVMEYALCLHRRGASAEVEKAFLNTMAVSWHYASCVAPSIGVSQQVAVYSC